MMKILSIAIVIIVCVIFRLALGGDEAAALTSRIDCRSVTVDSKIYADDRLAHDEEKYPTIRSLFSMHRLYTFSFAEEPSDGLMSKFSRLTYANWIMNEPRAGDRQMYEVIEFLLRVEPELFGDIVKNIFGEPISKADVQYVQMIYLRSGGIKDITIVRFLLKDGTDRVFAAKASKVTIDDEEENALWRSSTRWERFGPAEKKASVRYAGHEVVYFDSKFSRSSIIFCEYKFGPSALHIWDSNVLPLFVRKVAMVLAAEAYEKIYADCLIGIEDPKLDNIVASNGSLFDWAIIDLDRMLPNLLSEEEYAAIVYDYFSDVVPVPVEHIDDATASTVAVRSLEKVKITKIPMRFSIHACNLIFVGLAIDGAPDVVAQAVRVRARCRRCGESDNDIVVPMFSTLNTHSDEGVYRYGSVIPSNIDLSDIVIEISIDGGRTWSKEFLAVQDSKEVTHSTRDIPRHLMLHELVGLLRSA